MIIHVVILVGVLGAASVAALLAHRARKARWLAPPEFASSMSFVGSAYGLLLGLLVTFAVGHYTSVGSTAQQEASALLSLYNTTGAWHQPFRDHVRHELVCYMDSIARDEWPKMAGGSQFEARRTLQYGDQLRRTLRSLPQATPEERAAYGPAASSISTADSSRERLLYLTAPQIPPPLWVVLYVGAFLVFLMVSIHYAAKPAGKVWALGSVATLMVVVIGVLAILDQPFGVGTNVQPDELRHTVQLVLVGEQSKVILAPCQ